jgi:hypothetical protein
MSQGLGGLLRLNPKEVPVPVSITEAAASLGFRSRSTLYRLLDQDLLKDWEREGPKGQRWLELEGLQAQVQKFVRLQSNSPKRPQRGQYLEQEVDLLELAGGVSDASRFWEQVAPVANGFLDVSSWGPPPWSADRWVTLCHVIEMAVEEVQEKTSTDVSRRPEEVGALLESAGDPSQEEP